MFITKDNLSSHSHYQSHLEQLEIEYYKKKSLKNRIMNMEEILNNEELNKSNGGKGKRKKKTKKVGKVNKQNNNYISFPLVFLNTNNFDGDHKIQLGTIKLFQNRKIQDKNAKIHLKKIAQYINIKHIETARKALKKIEKMKGISISRINRSNLYKIKYRFTKSDFTCNLGLDEDFLLYDFYYDCDFIRVDREFFYSNYFASALLEVLYYYLAYNIKWNYYKISNERICSDLCISEKTLQRNCKKLEEMNLIKKYKGNGRKHKTKYELITDALLGQGKEYKV